MRYTPLRTCIATITLVAIIIVAGEAVLTVVDPTTQVATTQVATDSTAIALAAPIARRFEGLRLDPYHDADGFPTIGYGHKLSDERGAPLDRWARIDHAEANRLLAADLRVAATEVRALVDVTLQPHQLAALIDFVFNEGSGRLAKSTLLRRLNAGDFSAVPAELRRWVYGDGRVLSGLVERREAEARLWETPR